MKTAGNNKIKASKESPTGVRRTAENAFQSRPSIRNELCHPKERTAELHIEVLCLNQAPSTRSRSHDVSATSRVILRRQENINSPIQSKY